MTSTVKCIPCDRDITDRKDIIHAIKRYGNMHCKNCEKPLSISVSADDVSMLPEPFLTDALRAFSD